MNLRISICIILICLLNNHTIFSQKLHIFQDENIKINLPNSSVDTTIRFKNTDYRNIIYNDSSLIVNFSISDIHSNRNDLNSIDKFYEGYKSSLLTDSKNKIISETDTIFNDSKIRKIKAIYMLDDIPQELITLCFIFSDKSYTVQSAYPLSLKYDKNIQGRINNIFKSIVLKSPTITTDESEFYKYLPILFFLLSIIILYFLLKLKKTRKIGGVILIIISILIAIAQFIKLPELFVGEINAFKIGQIFATVLFIAIAYLVFKNGNRIYKE